MTTKEKFTVSVTRFSNEQTQGGKTYLTGVQWQPLTGELHSSYELAQAEIAAAIEKERLDKNYYKIDKYFVGE
jgi:hypothetical protein